MNNNLWIIFAFLQKKPQTLPSGEAVPFVKNTGPLFRSKKGDFGVILDFFMMGLDRGGRWPSLKPKGGP